MEQGYSVTHSPSGFQAAISTFQTPVQIALIALLAFLAYSNSLGVPFYFDDYTSLRDNPAIRHFGDLADFSISRIVGYFSFALNYALHGYDVAGYHLLNVLIHISSGLTVFFFVRTLLSLPTVTGNTRKSLPLPHWLPLLIALLFVLHPLQTQAVTYLTQRLASLAALFYLLSLMSYVQGRLAELPGSKLRWMVAAAVFTTLAFFTKQNTVTLPLAVLLLEICFLRPPRRYLLGVLGLGALLMLALVLFFRFGLNQSFVQFVASSTQETTSVTRGEYFTVQMQVLWSYIGKFFWPLTLHLDYVVPVPESFWNLKTIAFALGHLALIGGGIALIRRSPVIAFGILFYYAAHLVESSIIPIRDVGFEHRTYLPNFGLCLAVGRFALAILPRFVPAKAVAAGAVVVVLALGTLTWLRNDVWGDPIAFFQHEIAVNPDNFRAHSMLGENYLRLGQPPQALAAYREAYPLYMSMADKGTNAELAYVSNFVLALEQSNQFEEALSVLASVDFDALQPQPRALLLSRRGIIHARSDQFGPAEEDFRAALQADPRHLDSLNNLGNLLLLTERPAEARQMFERAYAVDPNSQAALQGLQILGVQP